MKIFITEDTDSEMIRIVTEEGKHLFEGNYWDFDFCGKNIQKLLKNAGLKVELTELNYDEWYK